MNSTPWVNWQQFASLNEEETKRTEEDRRQAREAEQEKFYNLTGQLQTEAQGQAGARQFGGLEKIGKYGEVTKARDEALAAQKNQPAGAAWEQYLDPGKNAAYRSPWADLDKKLGQITATAQQTQKNAIQNEKARQEAAYKEEEKRRAALIEKEEKRKAGIKQVEEDIKFGHTLEDFEKDLKSKIEIARFNAANAQAQGGAPNPFAAEQVAADLIIKYKLDRSDPRVRDLLKKLGLNAEQVDRVSPSGYGRPTYRVENGQLTMTMPPPAGGKK